MTTANLALFPKPRRKTNRVRGRTLRIVLKGHTAYLHGLHTYGLVEGAQLPRQYDHAGKVWTISRTRVQDLVTFAETFEGRVVTVEEAA